MKKNAYFYCDSKSINDATFHYIKLINISLENVGYQMKIVHNLELIIKPSLIITITEKYFLFAKIRYPFAKTMYWSQGIGQEESYMQSQKKDLRYIFRGFSEKMAVLNSDYLLMVSNTMKAHFKKKYKYNSKNYYILPCYNMELNNDVLNVDRYETPSFVYAGGATSWQCIKEMLYTYKFIENSLPNSSLTILTSSKELFMEEIQNIGIQRYEITYVTNESLNDKLSHYKYAFLLRENHIVNNVATPTKMSSYLASYLIPIYTTAVHDFVENINLGKYTLCFDTPISPISISKKIIDFEKNVKIDFNEYASIVKEIFNNHYNDEKHIKGIINLLNK